MADDDTLKMNRSSTTHQPASKCFINGTQGAIAYSHYLTESTSAKTQPPNPIMDAFYRHLSKIASAVCTVILLLCSNSTRANLTIVPIWDSTITTDPNASQITNTILQACAVYQATFSDNVTVYITFQEMSGGLGESSTYYNVISYQLYRSHLASDASTVYDTNALAHLPNTTTNPVNNAIDTDLSLPTGRAIGLTGETIDGLGDLVDWDSSASSPDATIYLNTSSMNLSRANTNALLWDLMDVTEHEINEVLGIGSALSDVNGNLPFPSGYASPEDFFRYDQNGNRSFTTNSTAQAYFSLDGKTLYARFNQTFGGDYNDWYSFFGGGNPPRVQDAFTLPGQTPDLNVELIVLDVLGYHLLIPKMTIAKAGAHQQTISWSPAPPGFILTESTNLLSTNWINSISSITNPVTVTTTNGVKFYRLNHP
jgi:hypothetical protein